MLPLLGCIKPRKKIEWVCVNIVKINTVYTLHHMKGLKLLKDMQCSIDDFVNFFIKKEMPNGKKINMERSTKHRSGKDNRR